MSYEGQKIGVVIPCYKVKPQLEGVINSIPSFVDNIWIVNDACPDSSADSVKHLSDPRISILNHEQNMGVGGAMLTGYNQAILDKVDIVIKIDGDGQMNPDLCEALMAPLIHGDADYTKGCRFYNPHFLRSMPTVRLIGNSALSLINKFVSGYWDIMDPTNGFTAIKVHVLSLLPLDKISKRYFFESDMLFRLSLLRARVIDFPMEASYNDEKSNLSISKVLVSFPGKYFKRFLKRLIYLYFLRDFNYGTISLVFGLFLSMTGVIWGSSSWYFYSMIKGTPAPSGTVVIPAMLIILGMQLLISFFHFDIQSTPQKTISNKAY